MPIDINYEIGQPHQKVIGLKDPTHSPTHSNQSNI